MFLIISAAGQLRKPPRGIKFLTYRAELWYNLSIFLKGQMNMTRILFVCHGNILRSLEKACYINGFHRSDGAYYTTITPFAKEL